MTSKNLIVTGPDVALVHLKDPAAPERGRWVRVKRGDQIPGELFDGEEQRLREAGVFDPPKQPVKTRALPSGKQVPAEPSAPEPVKRPDPVPAPEPK